MEVITLCNQKGGTGKTTSAAALATILAEDRDVLAIDMDPQGGLSSIVARRGEQAHGLISGDLPISQCAVETEFGFEVIPSNRKLASVEDFRAAKIATRLGKLFDAIGEIFDVVIMDPPPSTSAIVVGVMISSDRIIAPVDASQSAVRGLEDTISLAKQVGAGIDGMFVSSVDVRTNNDVGVYEDLSMTYGLQSDGGLLYDQYIRETVRVEEATRKKQPVPVYSPDCTASKDYRTLTEQMFAEAAVA